MAFKVKIFGKEVASVGGGGGVLGDLDRRFNRWWDEKVDRPLSRKLAGQPWWVRQLAGGLSRGARNVVALGGSGGSFYLDDAFGHFKEMNLDVTYLALGNNSVGIGGTFSYGDEEFEFLISVSSDDESDTTTTGLRLKYNKHPEYSIDITSESEPESQAEEIPKSDDSEEVKEESTDTETDETPRHGTGTISATDTSASENIPIAPQGSSVGGESNPYHPQQVTFESQISVGESGVQYETPSYEYQSLEPNGGEGPLWEDWVGESLEQPVVEGPLWEDWVGESLDRPVVTYKDSYKTSGSYEMRRRDYSDGTVYVETHDSKSGDFSAKYQGTDGKVRSVPVVRESREDESSELANLKFEARATDAPRRFEPHRGELKRPADPADSKTIREPQIPPKDTQTVYTRGAGGDFEIEMVNVAPQPKAVDVKDASPIPDDDPKQPNTRGSDPKRMPPEWIPPVDTTSDEAIPPSDPKRPSPRTERSGIRQEQPGQMDPGTALRPFHAQVLPQMVATGVERARYVVAARQIPNKSLQGMQQLKSLDDAARVRSALESAVTARGQLERTTRRNLPPSISEYSARRNIRQYGYAYGHENAEVATRHVEKKYGLKGISAEKKAISRAGVTSLRHNVVASAIGVIGVAIAALDIYRMAQESEGGYLDIAPVRYILDEEKAYSEMEGMRVKDISSGAEGTIRFGQFVIDPI